MAKYLSYWLKVEAANFGESPNLNTHLYQYETTSEFSIQCFLLSLVLQVS